MTPRAPAREAFAAAKVNLFLHVGPRGDDGYHPVASLIVFADIGDRLRLGGQAGPGLVIEGPFAAGLGAGSDNLVIAARDALSPDLKDVGLTLEKVLPLAAGLGGGSADAAAALRLLNPGLAAPLGAAALAEIGARLGADVPACLDGRPTMATGRGDRLAPAPRLPVLDAVLLNPGVASPTAAVYRAFDEAAGSASADHPSLPRSIGTAGEAADLVARTRNDLEAPAIALAPAIGAALDILRAAPETLVARMSGSGATAFALCGTAAKAETLAARVAADHPQWWVRACRLGGPWP
jgi:4-diphosphocytidyl-2-C-methyl-D-erythritol kinase